MIIPFIAGLLSGIVGGMGIGGGTILIPILVFILHVDQHVAQSINLIFFVPTAIVALSIHIKNHRVDLKVAAIIALFGIVGAILGSRFAVSVASGILKKMFGFFLFTMGIYQILRK